MKTTSTNRKEKQTNPIRRNAGIVGVAMMTIFMTSTISFAQRTNVGNGVNTISTEQIGSVDKNPGVPQQVKNTIPTVLSMVPLCSGVTSINMVDKSFDKVMLSWDNSTNFDSITFRYALSGTTTYRTVTISGTPNTGFYILQGLTPQTTYDFDLSSLCSNGGTSNWTAPLTITTFAEPAPRFAANNSNNQRSNIMLKVNPNPATLSTVISYVAPVNSSNLIIISTSAGREVYRTQEICTAGKMQHSVDVSNLTPGLYFVRVFIGTNASVERLIVQ